MAKCVLAIALGIAMGVPAYATVGGINTARQDVGGVHGTAPASSTRSSLPTPFYNRTTRVVPFREFDLLVTTVTAPPAGADHIDR